jgi:hypothetical protein
VIQITVFHVALGLKDYPDVGADTEVRINFGEERGDCCLSVKGYSRQHTRNAAISHLLPTRFISSVVIATVDLFHDHGYVGFDVSSGSDFREKPMEGTSTCASNWHVALVPVTR